MFHRFRASANATAGQGALSPDELEQILLYVGVENILSPHEWMARLEQDALSPDDLCVTFDDGLRSQADHALPVLERHGLQAFWFVYSCVFDGVPVKGEIYSQVAGQIDDPESLAGEFLDGCPPEMTAQLDSPAFAGYAARMREVAPFYSANDIKFRFLRNQPANKCAFEALMDEIVAGRGFDIEALGRRIWLAASDLAALADAGHAVGLHSYDHPYDMAKRSPEEQRRQYERNHAHIASVTKRAPECMSHPLNAYNEDSLSILSDLGIRCGFRANVLPPSSKGVNPSRLELAREDASNLMSMLSHPPSQSDVSKSRLRQ
jgi:peptidoglycan/xylan/chitin deacetylase (PgdA/CDA1 family)